MRASDRTIPIPVTPATVVAKPTVAARANGVTKPSPHAPRHRKGHPPAKGLTKPNPLTRARWRTKPKRRAPYRSETA